MLKPLANNPIGYPASRSLARHTPGTMESRKGSSTSLVRALAILELVSQKSGGVTNAEISRKLKIATSTTCYILSRLEREGYLVREPEHGRYEMGLKIVALAHGALREMGLRRIAEPILHQLAADTNYSGLIGVLERGLVMIVDKVEQPDLAKIDMDIGVRYPAHTTALGKVLFAHRPAKEIENLFDRFGSINTSPKSIRSKDAFLGELEAVRTQGYAISDGELFLGIRAIAAPIFESSGAVRAAVSATGCSLAVEEGRLIAHTMRAAKQISSRLATSETAKLPRQ